MSRLIVKNLPKNITEERVKTIFAEMGQITDLKLKYTKNGVFRRFAFVGFKTHTEAERALKHFHNTFIDTSKLRVDICKDLGDETAPRPWSKYSEKSSAFQKKAQKDEERKRALEGKTDEEKLGKVVKKKKTASALLGELENDRSFQEFLEVHKSGSKKNIWSNDEQLEVKLANKEKSVYNKVGNLYFTVVGKCKDARENATWVIIMLGSHKFRSIIRGFIFIYLCFKHICLFGFKHQIHLWSFYRI